MSGNLNLYKYGRVIGDEFIFPYMASAEDIQLYLFPFAGQLEFHPVKLYDIILLTKAINMYGLDLTSPALVPSRYRIISGKQ